jgi:hypothetical protein
MILEDSMAVARQAKTQVCSRGPSLMRHTTKNIDLISSMAWKTPFPQSRLPAYIEFVQ